MPKLTWNMLWVVLGVLLIATAAYYSFTFITAPRIDIRKFTGNIIGVDDKTIKLHGVFYGAPGAIPKELTAPRDFSFKINDSTTFQKITIQLPTLKELSDLGGRFNLQDRPRKNEPGSLADIVSSFSAGGVYVEAGFPSSIYNPQNPIASYVIYRVMTSPVQQ